MSNKYSRNLEKLIFNKKSWSESMEYPHCEKMDVYVEAANNQMVAHYCDGTCFIVRNVNIEGTVELHSKEYFELREEALIGLIKEIAESVIFFKGEIRVHEGSDIKDRYPMCKDQPAQIDCRNTECRFHENGACINVSPALTITDGKVTCWTKNTEEEKMKKKIETLRKAISLLNSMVCSGEEHSDSSRVIVSDACRIMDEMESSLTATGSNGKSDLELLEILKFFFVDNYGGDEPRLQLSGLCSVFERMVFTCVIKPTECTRLHNYFKELYDIGDSFWWPKGKYRPRLRAINKCIQDEKAFAQK